MDVTPVPLIDTGQDFDFSLQGRHYRGRRYSPGSIIDLDQFVDFDADSHDIEYYFQDFLTPVDTIDLRDVVSPLSPALWDRTTQRFGIVHADLWIIR